MDSPTEAQPAIGLELAWKNVFVVVGRQELPSRVQGSVRFFVECYRQEARLLEVAERFAQANGGRAIRASPQSWWVPVLTVSARLHSDENEVAAFVRIGSELFTALRTEIEPS